MSVELLHKLFRFHGGLHLPEFKDLSTATPVAAARLPQHLIVPTQQHIGVAAEPIVTVGDYVFKGQKIARGTSFIAAPVHAPSSGTVVDIADYPVPHPSGQTACCIVIETDGQDIWADHRPVAHDFRSLPAEDLRELIRLSGIVGLGGAGFPSYIKLSPAKTRVIDTLILNGAECEPYITCDDMLMRERADDIIRGIHIMAHALNAQRCVIAVEDNKPQAIASLRAALEQDGSEQISVVAVPTLYPGGGEKQLIKVITGKEVPYNRLPLDIRVVCHNVATAAAIYRAICHGEPLISRYITITGDCGTPRNLEVLLGTPVRDLLEQCDIDPAQIDSLVMGGPMMGFALPSIDVPVIKTTNCLLALSAAQPRPTRQQTYPCIRCGACSEACPVDLLPQQLYWFAHSKNFDKVQDYSLFDCIECGCCDYVCPSQIPLVQYFRFAKSEIWAQDEEKRKSEIARQRHEFRQLRLEREKAERAQRHKQKAAAVKDSKTPDGEAAKKAAIQAAMARAKEKRGAAEAQDSAGQSDEHAAQSPQATPNKTTME